MKVVGSRNSGIAFTGALLAWFSVLLGGCAHDPVKLKAHAPVHQTATRIDRPIAFLHSQTFCTRTWKIAPYGANYVLTLEAGEASDRVLRETYKRIFATSLEVASRSAFTALGGPDAPVALLVPTIVEGHYMSASHRSFGPFYAQIEYWFTLIGRDDTTVASWGVRGFGQYDAKAEADSRSGDSSALPSGQEATAAEAARRAIEVASANFARSFERVPELIRWRRGQPVTGAEVPIRQQRTTMRDGDTPIVRATYPGVLVLEVERTPVPRPPKNGPEDSVEKIELTAMRLKLYNESTHSLALDPADIEWIVGSDTILEPLPPRVAAALITRKPFAIAAAPGVGAAAIPALVAGLISAAELERHKRELKAWSAVVSEEMLVDGIAAPGTNRTGLIYFPELRKKNDKFLVIRVIDVDAALRYTVLVPTSIP